MKRLILVINLTLFLTVMNDDVAKVGVDLGLGLRFSCLPGIIKLSEILRSSST